MAKFLSFDKKNFNSSGVIDLKRGDDWKLQGTVVDKYAKYAAPFDLSDIISATAYWPAASGGVITEAFNIISAKGGQFELDVPASDTPSLSLEDSTTVYVVIDDANLGIVTIESEYSMISIQDRSFQGA